MVFFVFLVLWHKVGNLANGSYGYGSRTSEWDRLYQAEKCEKVKGSMTGP